VKQRCNVAICGRNATILVTFRHSPDRPYPYCDFHAINRRGEVRWGPIAVTAAHRITHQQEEP
jgi:hypothetical protein